MAEQQGSDTCPEAVELAFLNVTEAAALWRGITGEEVTPVSYENMCVSGELEAKGVGVTIMGGATWLTDMDSLLAYLDRTIMQQHRRIKEALEERRVELEGL